ncbi:MAG: CBS domain-containing protein [Desulfosarcinaceae bacterium]|nr:CBS domain-containing protein [Desulfosarcinaceae bacterium]
MQSTPSAIITTHRNADFDALASVVAAGLIYPDAQPVLPKQVNPNVRGFLSIHKDIFDIPRRDEIELDAVRRLIVVDANRWDRLDRFEELRERTGLDLIVWDHHEDSGQMPHRSGRIMEMGSTTTLLTRVLDRRRKLLTPMQATLMLAGLYEDTGNLSFSSTRAEDAYAAGYLLDRKADLTIVNKFLRPAYGEKQKAVLFDMLKAARRQKINGYSVSFSRLSIEGHVSSLAVVVAMYRDIVNVDAAFGIFESSVRKRKRARCMVIGRSGIEGLDMGAIMRSLGGGGHPGAGSAQLREARPEAVEGMIRDLIAGNQQASVQISDLMSFPVQSVDETTSMETVARLLRKKGYTGLPVVRGEDLLVGVISRRDFRKIRKEAQLKAPVKAFMSTEARTIAPGLSPIHAARIMVRHDVGRLPVVAKGKIIGIITRSDTMRYFYDLLPD